MPYDHEDEEMRTPEKIDLAYIGKIGGGVVLILSLLAFASDHESRHTKVEVLLEEVLTDTQMILDHLLSVAPTSKVPVKE